MASEFVEARRMFGARIVRRHGALFVQDMVRSDPGNWVRREGHLIASAPDEDDASAVRAVLAVAKALGPAAEAHVEEFLRDRAQYAEGLLHEAVVRAELAMDSIEVSRHRAAVARDLSDLFNVVDAEIVDEIEDPVSIADLDGGGDAI
jgi:hypothetical protein